MKNLLISVIFPVIVILSGCSKRPKDILSEDKMVAVMADLQVAEAYERAGDTNDFLKGKNREILGKSILLQHGVSSEEMDSTLAWYGRNMDEYSKLYKKIDIELNKRQLKYARAAGESENEGPSADLWPYGRHFAIDNNTYSDGLVVNIPVTELQPGDKITWKMATQGATARLLTLGVDYDNGTAEISKVNNRGFEKWVEASIQTDTALTVNRIFAIARFEHSNPRVFIDSVQLIHIPFNKGEVQRGGYQRKVGLTGRKIILPPDTSANSSLVPDSIASKPLSSTANNRGVRTLR